MLATIKAVHTAIHAVMVAAQAMERILEDGVVTKREEGELDRLIQNVMTAAAPKSSHYVIVELEQGTREW